LFVPRINVPEVDARARVRRWLLWYRRTRYQDRTDADLAKALGIAATTLSPILSGKRAAGFDVFVKLHRVGGIPADLLLESDPPTGK